MSDSKLDAGYNAAIDAPFKRFTALQVERVEHGGYLVSPGFTVARAGDYIGPLFACSTLDEALSFVRDNIMENAKVGLSADQYKQLAEKGYISRKATAREEELLAPVAAILQKAKRRGRRHKPGRPRKAK